MHRRRSQPYRKILIKGTAELVHDVGEDDKWRDMYLSMASRYVPEAGARAYVKNTIKEPRGLYRVDLRLRRSKVGECQLRMKTPWVSGINDIIDQKRDSRT